MKSIIQLIITVTLSCIAISLLGFGSKFYYYYLISFFAPGVLFSIFILKNTTKQFSLLNSALVFIVLQVLWLVSFYCTAMTWGWAAPFFGGFSAWFIGRNFIIKDNQKPENTSLTLAGGISSLFGLIFFYILLNTINSFGASMIGIIAFWQISIGVKIIKIKRLNNLEKYLSRE